jgi:orotate phosphoribosyltransferase
MKEQEVIADLEETDAFLTGHFELRSGLHSNQYIQCAMAMRYPRVAEKLCAALVLKMNTALPDLKADAVVAPAMGGIVVGHEVARALNVRSIFVEKEDGKLVLRRFRIKAGERYVIAEDVITRGGRVDETLAIIRAHGAEVVAVGVLVNRSGGRTDFGCPTFSLLEIEPETFAPEECPMCKKGEPITHPGS